MLLNLTMPSLLFAIKKNTDVINTQKENKIREYLSYILEKLNDKFDFMPDFDVDSQLPEETFPFEININANISYLLLAWVKAAPKSPLTITEVSKVVEASLLTKRDLRELLDVPDPLTQNQNVNELELNL